MRPNLASATSRLRRNAESPVSDNPYDRGFPGSDQYGYYEKRSLCTVGVLNAVLGLDRKGSPTDSTFLYLFERVDLAELFSMLRSWMLERIASEGREVTQLVCDGKTLRGSAVGGEYTAERFVAQVTLYARELGVA